MDELISFLTNKGFCKNDSETTVSIGGDSIEIWDSPNFKVKLSKDKGQCFLDFLGKLYKKEEWFSIGVIRKLLTQEEDFFDVLNNDNMVFLELNFNRISDLFSAKNIEQTIQDLKIKERERAKKLFG